MKTLFLYVGAAVVGAVAMTIVCALVGLIVVLCFFYFDG